MGTGYPISFSCLVMFIQINYIKINAGIPEI